MYNRSSLKQTAKDRLSQSGRWLAVVAVLIASYLCMGSSTSSFSGGSFQFNINFPSSSPSFDANTDLSEVIEWLGPVFLGAFSTIALFATAFSVLVANVAVVGLRKWFLEYSRQSTPSLLFMFYGFQHYRSTVLAMLLRKIYTVLWTLLFIIPGIIKSYSYALVPYLLADNPNMKAKDALRASEAMMKGWKWQAFLFDLSFFGWHLLNVLTVGIVGILYFQPYYNTASALFYDLVKYDALYNRGVIGHALFMPPTDTTGNSFTDPVE